MINFQRVVNDYLEKYDPNYYDYFFKEIVSAKYREQVVLRISSLQYQISTLLRVIQSPSNRAAKIYLSSLRQNLIEVKEKTKKEMELKDTFSVINLYREDFYNWYSTNFQKCLIAEIVNAISKIDLPGYEIKVIKKRK